MSEQAPNNNSGGNNPNQAPGQPRRNNNRRRNNNNRPRENAPSGQAQSSGEPRPPRDQNAKPQGQQQQGAPRDPNRPQGQAPNPNQKRRPQHNNNRPRPQGQGQNQNNAPREPREPAGPFNIERIYEKYLNLLDQHIIARRKYHDLFYRADPPQKNKLEKNFYNTLNDIREFESRLAPDVKTLFEKRNNGYQYDRTYTSNHEIPVEGDPVPSDLPPAEPHYLQSQIAADFADDLEESVGTAEDYLKYKNF